MRDASFLSVIFTVPGILLLLLSVLDLNMLFRDTQLTRLFSSITENSVVLAFIGLGLVFWGGLFFLVRPLSYVRSSLLEATSLTYYANLDRITKDLKFDSKSYYIPPYPKEVYLPEHLKGLKDMVVYISTNDSLDLPSIDVMAASKFILEDNKGIIVEPPGQGLVGHIEKELNANITEIDLDDLCNILLKIIPENLLLAKELSFTSGEDLIHLKIVESIYYGLYTNTDSQSIRSMGPPLASAIACILAKNTGKPVTISDLSVNPISKTIDVTYQVIDV